MISVFHYHQPKLGNSESEYEDAFSYDVGRGLFAMADGSSESVFSNEWAKSLVDTFVSGKHDMKLDDMVETALGMWRSKLPWSNMKWFVKNKIARGSMSTFLGLEIQDGGFKSVAVGDTCLFIITPEGMKSFPIKNASEFGNTPKLIWTGNPLLRTRRSVKWANYMEGRLSESDILIMATDSLAHWMISRAKQSPWKMLIDHSENEGELISGLINSGEMKNDDVTFAVISLR
ncbi:hypothetical protein [Thermoplasma sp.]|uniref:hypothetical protein n=1 Tax=Thermoplasma sp. TaxID=1973142 RepID=UPI00127CBC9C|nr:hypothetical protein [Thermoplasma sp.]KAA8923426.1 MAG: hypothetical protein F6Q11_00265 [Thermoplasma sp.]